MYTLEKSAKNSAIFHITVSAEDVKRGLDHAAEHMGESLNIPGFRIGKAPAHVVRAHIGEQALLDHATEELIRAAFSEAILAEKIDIVGQPYFTMKKMSATEGLEFDVEVALMPQVTKLADYNNVTIEKKPVNVPADALEKSKKDLLRMATVSTRALAGRELTKGDKAVLSLSMKKDGVTVDGGEANNHAVFTNEEHYIPGFIDAIIGLKEGESRTFTLPFPTDHYQKHLAGQNVDFNVNLTEIHTLEEPLFDDAFAKRFGFATITELEAKLQENLSAEQEKSEFDRQEKELLETLAQKSTFDEISDLLINSEIEKMIEELKNWVTNQGLEFDQYLQNSGLTIAQLKLDFAPQAMTRLKVALVLTAVAKAEKIAAAEEEVDAEIDRVAKTFEGNKQAIDMIYAPSFRDRVTTQLTNKATIEFLKQKMVK